MDSNNILKIAVCDDEESALEIIASAVTMAFNNHDIKIILDKYASVSQLENNISVLNYDLLLLDIKIKNNDGVAFAQKLRDENVNIPIIFVSSQEERVFETFAVKPFGFIRKSHFLNDVVSVIDSFIESVSERVNTKIVIKINGKMINLGIDDIIYIESYGKEQDIYLKGRKEPLVTVNSMREFEEQLSGFGFMRVHKSYLVNYKFIQLVGADYVELTSGKKLPVGRTYAKTVKQEYLKRMSSRGSVIFD